jgi:hypothetical protein
MIKYRSGGYNKNGAPIEAVEVQRETQSTIWINGKRGSKRTEYDNYFDTWDEAKEFLLSKASSELASARRKLERAQGEYGNIKGLKAPAA